MGAAGGVIVDLFSGGVVIESNTLGGLSASLSQASAQAPPALDPYSMEPTEDRNGEQVAPYYAPGEWL